VLCRLGGDRRPCHRLWGSGVPRSDRCPGGAAGVSGRREIPGQDSTDYDYAVGFNLMASWDSAITPCSSPLHFDTHEPRHANVDRDLERIAILRRKPINLRP
jgi:hypothetical protein